MKLAREAGVKMAKETRLKNTMEAYQKPVRLWSEWCRARDFNDGEHVNDSKLIWFLIEVVAPLQIEPPKTKRGKQVKKKVRKKAK
jgi:hypothetical protein